jgi:hypothetical protein
LCGQKTHLCALAATSKEKKEKKSFTSFTSFAIVFSCPGIASALYISIVASEVIVVVFGLWSCFCFCIAFCISACNRILGAPQLRQTESAAPKTAAQQRKKKKKQKQRKASPPRDSVCDVSIDSSASCDIQPGTRLAKATRRSPNSPACPPASKSASCNLRGPSSSIASSHRQRPIIVASLSFALAIGATRHQVTARICSAHLPIVRAFNQSAALLCRMVAVSLQLLGRPANKPVAATANHIQDTPFLVGGAFCQWLRRIGT